MTATDLPPAELDDWFDDAPAAPAYGLGEAIGRGVRGRYHFPAPPGETASPNGWMRMSNLAGAFSDQRALQLYLERETLRGLRAADDLYDDLCAQPPEALTDDYLKTIADRARERAGANAASVRGTARHTMLQGYLETGAINGNATMRMQLVELLVELDKVGLELLPAFSERLIWHPAGGGTMGRLDARVRCTATGQEGVIDLKTKRKKFWTMQEVAGQQAGYSDAPWIWRGPPNDSGHWVKAPANTLLGTSKECRGKPVALIAHMPQVALPEDHPDHVRIHIREVDIEYGRAVLEVAARNVELRSVGKSTSEKRQVHGLRSSAIVE